MAAAFRRVSGLWLAPDFGPVQRGQRAAPYVNHDEVDYAGRVAFLEDHFYCGERVRVRVPDDTIDQVTIHYRMAAGGLVAVRDRCAQFARTLLEATKGDRSPIPIRQHWYDLHHLKDRTHSPPPVLLMFVLEGTFEAVHMWLGQAQLRLGIRAGDIAIMMSGDVDPKNHEGQLNPPLATVLERNFGIG